VNKKSDVLHGRANSGLSAMDRSDFSLNEKRFEKFIFKGF
jgi:hypothetical protein